MRNKLFICLLLCTVLLSGLGIGAYAQATDNGGLGYVADVAQILTPQERQELDGECAQVSQRYGCGVYIVTVPDYRDYSTAGVEEAAEAVYKSCGLGIGDEKNGIMLLLSMDDREYDLCAFGSVAHTAFTDYGKDSLADSFLDDFRDDDWAAGFSDYVRECWLYLDYAEQGSPVDVPGAGQQGAVDKGVAAAMIILPPCVIALIVCLIFKSQMKTARVQTEARDYIGESGVNMRVVQDRFTHRTQTVTVIREDNNRGHGGGGTSINSGGFSHSSGKF